MPKAGTLSDFCVDLSEQAISPGLRWFWPSTHANQLWPRLPGGTTGRLEEGRRQRPRAPVLSHGERSHCLCHLISRASDLRKLSSLATQSRERSRPGLVHTEAPAPSQPSRPLATVLFIKVGNPDTECPVSRQTDPRVQDVENKGIV